MDKDYIGKDKVYHLIVCLVISVYSTEMAISVGITKEYCDSRSEGNHWCWWDILADLIGTIIGTAIRLLVIKRWNWL